MKFIQSCSYTCARYLSNQLNENHEKRRVYYYGFQVVIGAIVKGILLVAVSLLFRALIPAIIVAAAFGTLRKVAGGYHMNTYLKCIVVSMSLFISAAIFSRYTYIYWSKWGLIILAILTLVSSALIIMKWAPCDTPNRPVTKPEEIRKFRLSAMIYEVLWALLVSVVLYLEPVNYQMYVIAASLGILMESITITPIGNRFLQSISGSVDHINR